MEDDVFSSDTETKQPLILIGASHLARVARLLDTEKWEIFDLTRPGFCINETSVSEITSEVVELGKAVQLDNSTAILQLYDNTVYQVGGPGGTRSLPKPDYHGHYHIEGTLQVADKAAVKEMTGLLAPLLKALGQAKKTFLAPLTRYWLKPCCDDPLHHLNYAVPTYLPALGASVFRLRDNIRDALYTRRCSNFWVVCANRLIGIGPQLSDEAAKIISQMWGSDPVHPRREAYEALAAAIESDILTDDVKFANPPKTRNDNRAKKPRTDLSHSRQGWVVGCSAIIPRKDTISSSRGRGHGGPSRGRGAWKWRAGKGNRGRGGGGHPNRPTFLSALGSLLKAAYSSAL
jgi:hypothetical protein